MMKASNNNHAAFDTQDHDQYWKLKVEGCHHDHTLTEHKEHASGDATTHIVRVRRNIKNLFFIRTPLISRRMMLSEAEKEMLLQTVKAVYNARSDCT